MKESVIALLVLALTSPVSSSLTAQSAPRVEASCLCGKIVDRSGTPIPNVELELIVAAASNGIRTQARSAGDGSFSLFGPARGTGELRLRRLGYLPKSVVVLFDTLTTSRTIAITLETAPAVLAPVKVEAPGNAQMRGFNERRRQRGTGHYIDRVDIEKKRPAYTSDLLRSVPGMTVLLSSRFGALVRVRGCKPAIFLDGIQAVGAELDDVTRPNEIDGMEVYSSWAAIPPQFNDRMGGKCGAIIVWTRIQ